MNLSEYIMREHEKGKGRATAIGCRDGFSISVQAHSGAYCIPRQGRGPWTHVECGYPSAKPEFIMDRCEDPNRPTNTVYGYVPVGQVEQLIAFHGGSEQLE